MRPEQIVSHSSAELAALFPDKSRADILKMRKRAHNALWQRRYRTQGRDSSNPYLGSFDGPAIERCPTYEKLTEDAKFGSIRLRDAILRTGVRP